MSVSGTFSEPGRLGRRSWDVGPRARARLLVALLLTAPSFLTAGVLLTVDEALALVFPDATTERESRFLTDGQLKRVGELAGARPESALVTRFCARREGGVVGYAYLDTHRVRTLPETLLVVLEPHGVVRRVEVLSFSEPGDYLPRDAWYGQFAHRSLDRELDLKRGIHPVTGATLTARATTEAVRRVLAEHAVLEEAASP